MSAQRAKQRKSNRAKGTKAPTYLGWSTTDAQEVDRRRWRGRTQVFGYERLEPDFGHFANFQVDASWGGSYTVEIRDLKELRNSCTCRDFETSGLGTCKHIEGVLHLLAKSGKRRFNAAAKEGSSRIEVYIGDDPEDGPVVAFPDGGVPAEMVREVEARATAVREGGGTESLARLQEMALQNPELLRVSGLVSRWLERNLRDRERQIRRDDILEEIESGRLSLDLIKYSLFPYQRDGVLHLALGERAMLADDMGLGKTVQAIAATELLSRIGNIERVVVVTPTSLMAEWVEQISGATDRSCQTISGPLHVRLQKYRNPAFFTIVNYERVRIDVDRIGDILKPDLVILDEAQRIKNWRTKTAESVKRLPSRYAFVLTGTPLENRIDDVYSIVQYLDPGLLGPLFRFNRRYYVLNERGRPESLQNLDELHQRVSKVMLRRRKTEIEQDLPDRTVNNYYLPMTEVQLERYTDYELDVRKLGSIAKKRLLTEEEFKRLQLSLACMRMLCDTPYILDDTERTCPKLDELIRILEDLLSEPSSKVIIFSEWVRMLNLVGERLGESDIEFAWHTGSVPLPKRREEVLRFREDPDCRVFLSSESGGAGLNLQVANAVVNLDLPWNPARLEQRIARAWRKHQKRSVSVVNLVSESTIEHRMLYLLDEKQTLSDAVLDGETEDGTMRLPSGREAFLERLEKLLQPFEAVAPHVPAPDPAEESLAALKDAHDRGLYAVELRKDKAGNQFLLVALESVPAPEDGDALAARCAWPVQRIDRQSYLTMLRMEESGLLDFSASRVEVLHLDSPEERAKEEARRNREEALALLEDADRRQRMASLLTGGGFALEAAKQAGPIASLAVRALALHVGLDGEDDGGADADRVSPDICQKLVEAGALPEEMEIKAYWLCAEASDDGQVLAAEAGENGGLQDVLPSAAALLADAERILDHAKQHIAA